MSCRSNFDSPQHLRVSVKVGQSQFIIAHGRPEVPFFEIINQLAFILKTTPGDLREYRFACVGCQRIFYTQKERKEKLPAECCPIRGLQMLTLTNADYGDDYIYSDVDNAPKTTPQAERRVYVTVPSKSATLRPHSVTSLVANVKRKSATLPSKRKTTISLNRTSTSDYEELENTSVHSEAIQNDFEFKRGSAHDYAELENASLHSEVSQNDFELKRGSALDYAELGNTSLHSEVTQNNFEFQRCPSKDYEELKKTSSSLKLNPGAANTSLLQIGDEREQDMESNVGNDGLKVQTSSLVESGSRTEIYSIDMSTPFVRLEDSAAQNEMSPDVVNIQLTLPDCEPLRVSLNRDITLASLIDSALFNRKWFPVADLTSNSCGSLYKLGENWKTWTLEECGIGNGDDIVVKADTPTSVHVSVFSPLHFEALTMEQVDLEPQDWSWWRIQAKINSKHKNPQETFNPHDIAYQILVLHNRLSMLFLEPTSGLSFSDSELPQICVLRDTDILLVSNRDLEWALPSSVSIFESRWLLLLSGIATSDLRPSGLFLALDQRRFINTNSGAKFDSRETAIATLPDAFASDVRGFVMLLEDGNRVPRWAMPKQVRPQLWCRSGRSVEIRDRRIHARGGPEVKFAESGWLLQQPDETLVKNFTKAARKSN